MESIKLAERNANIQNLEDAKSFIQKLILFPGDDLAEENRRNGLDQIFDGSPDDLEGGFTMLLCDGLGAWVHENEIGYEIELYFCDRKIEHSEKFEDIDSMIDWLIDYPELCEIRQLTPKSIPTWEIKD